MKIYIHFAGTDHVSMDAIDDVVVKISNSLIAAEKRELRRLKQAVPEIPSEAVGQTLNKLEKYTDGKRILQLQAVKRGSVGVYLLVSALAYWLLDKTLSETVSEAWKNTNLHKKIVSFFLKGQDDKLRRVQLDLNKGIKTPDPLQARSSFELEVPIRADLDEEKNELHIRIEYTETYKVEVRLPTYEEIDENHSE